MRSGVLRVFLVTGAASASLAAVAASSAAVLPAQAPPPPPPPPPPAEPPIFEPVRIVPPGVKIAKTAVGGLSEDEAAEAVAVAFAEPVRLRVGRRIYPASPARLGARARIRDAVRRALAAVPGQIVPLAIDLRQPRARAVIAGLARRIDRAPADARLSFRAGRPWISKERNGYALHQPAALRVVVRALVRHIRTPLRLRTRVVAPSVTRRDYGPIVVIRRGLNKLDLYDGMRFWRRFGVATGLSAYPTPLGRFEIVVKARHPWWYPPDSDWAAGQEPVPPGPDNPLGTRWMGLSASGVGIHGTPNAASIGYSASHGCIRMRIPEAEWLFNVVRVGTPVFIVPR